MERRHAKGVYKRTNKCAVKKSAIKGGVYRHPAQQHHKEVRANRAKCTKGLRPHDKVEVDGRTCFLTTVKANGTCAFEDILGNMLTNANGNRREVTYRKVRRIQAATSVMREWVEAWGNF